MEAAPVERWTVLYTHQKQKKHKTWQDGVLRWKATAQPPQASTDPRVKVVLVDEQGTTLDDAFLLRAQLLADETVDTGRYLVQLCEPLGAVGSAVDKPKEPPALKPAIVRPPPPPRWKPPQIQPKARPVSPPTTVLNVVETQPPEEPPVPIRRMNPVLAQAPSESAVRSKSQLLALLRQAATQQESSPSSPVVPYEDASYSSKAETEAHENRPKPLPRAMGPRKLLPSTMDVPKDIPLPPCPPPKKQTVPRKPFQLPSVLLPRKLYFPIDEPSLSSSTTFAAITAGTTTSNKPAKRPRLVLKSTRPMLTRRQEKLPDRFPHARAYFLLLRNACMECVQLEICNVAQSMYLALHAARKSQQPSAETALHGKGLVKPFQSKGVLLHTECELHAYDARDILPGQTSPAKKYILALSDRFTSKSYSKDDLWMLAPSLDFSRSEYVLMRSVWHGPSQNNVIELALMDPGDAKLAARFATPNSHPSKKQQYPSNKSKSSSLLALRLLNASSDFLLMDRLGGFLEMLENDDLDILVQDRFPLLPSLLGAPLASSPARIPWSAILSDDCDALMEETIREYKLNQDQARVVTQFVHSIQNPDGKPITLCHGVFGAGKSFLVAVLIILLHRLSRLPSGNKPLSPAKLSSSDTGKDDEDASILSSSPDPNLPSTQQHSLKILIASNTNVAVDRILLSLKEMNFHDFVRVGSLKKMAKRVLPHAVQTQRDVNADLQDLQKMLSESVAAEEERDIQRAIELFKEEANRNILESAFVVGATCISTTFAMLQQQEITFPIVILDECSQITEPMSLLPLASFQCHRCLLIGDPLQLPPTLPAATQEHVAGLERTLFERAADALDCQPILLRTQYRCHPDISAIVNTLFYKNQLENGANVEQRPPAIRGLPAVCFVHVPTGKEEATNSGSLVNVEEARWVVSTVHALLNRDSFEDSVGVVSLYKGQALRIRSDLNNTNNSNGKNHHGSILVSTVDAFQGGERDLILLSTVRSNASKTVGFIDDERRINVALTRARKHLIIFGNRDTVQSNVLWSQILARCHVYSVDAFRETVLAEPLDIPPGMETAEA